MSFILLAAGFNMSFFFLGTTMNPLAVASQIHQKFLPSVVPFVAPDKLGWIVTKMPKSINAQLTQKILNSIFSEQISDGDFDFLEGRLLQIEIIDACLFISLSYRGNSVICQHIQNKVCHADATLSINSLDAINLIQQNVDPDTLFFQRKLKIKGDTELAHHVKNTIDTLNPEGIPAFLINLLSQYKETVLS